MIMLAFRLLMMKELLVENRKFSKKIRKVENLVGKVDKACGF